MSYESGDPYDAFLPSAVETDAEGNTPFHRGVVIVTERSIKGTERSGQEYLSPLLVLTGDNNARVTFEDLLDRICDALRGNRAPVLMEALLPDGSHKIFRQKKPHGESASGSSGRESAPSSPRRVRADSRQLLLPSILPELPGWAGGLQFVASAERGSLQIVLASVPRQVSPIRPIVTPARKSNPLRGKAL